MRQGPCKYVFFLSEKTPSRRGLFQKYRLAAAPLTLKSRRRVDAALSCGSEGAGVTW